MIHGEENSILIYITLISVKSGITTKFTANYDAIEDSLKTSTVGLVTLDEMREKQRDVVEARFSRLSDALLIDMKFFLKFEYTVETVQIKLMNWGRYFGDWTNKIVMMIIFIINYHKIMIIIDIYHRYID